MKYNKNVMLAAGGLAVGLLVSLSAKKLYNKLTELKFGNIIDYESKC